MPEYNGGGVITPPGGNGVYADIIQTECRGIPGSVMIILIPPCFRKENGYAGFIFLSNLKIVLYY